MLVPLVPVVPGSDEAKKYAAIADEQTKGLHAAEKMFCRDRETLTKAGGREIA